MGPTSTPRRSSAPQRRQWTIAGVTASLALVLAACGSDSDSDSDQTPTRFGQAHAALCHSAAAAAAGDGDAARTEFLDHIHQPLHELAPEATKTDRAAAGRLLERKERAEDALDGDPAVLADRLDQLIPAMAAAITATGDPEPPTCQETK